MKTVLKAFVVLTTCFLLTAKNKSLLAQCTAPGGITVVQPTNCTAPNGSITIGSPSPLANYQFSKDDGLTFQSSNIFTGLAPGTYLLRSKEIATGCISTQVVQVLTNPAAAITSTTGSNVNCAGTPTGSITFTAPASGYTYSINGGTTFQAGASFSNLAAGTYSLVAKSISSGCTSAATVVVTNNFTLPTTPVTSTSPITSCTTPDGIISVNSPLPLANFTFSIDGGVTYQAGSLFTDLGPGTYNVVAKSKTTGCVSAAQAVTLTAPVVATPAASVSSNTNCTGTPNGSITFSSPTPAANFTFSKDGGVTFQASNVFSNLPAGSYQLVAKSNASGCLSAASVFTVNNNFTPVTTPSVTNVNPSNCTAPNGSITITSPASGVTYSINGGLTFQASNVFSNLAPGSYSVVAQSTTTGCISIATAVTLVSNPVVPTPVSTNVNNSSCNNTPNGSITVTSPAGANFQYSLNGGAFQSGTSFTGLTGGAYTVVAQNTTTGCSSAALNVTLTNSPAFSVTTTNVNPTNCSPANGQITVTSPTPAANYTFSIDGGVTFQASNVFTGLVAGSYSVVARSNITTCISTPLSVTLSSPAAVTGVNVTLVNNSSCTAPGNGSITFTGPVPLANFTFSINNGVTFQASPSFTGLTGGTYVVIAKNTATGCTSAGTNQLLLNVPVSVPVPAFSVSNVTDCNSPNGNITITGPAGILSGHTYSINSGLTFQASPVFNNLSAGTYNVVARNTSTGCISTGTNGTISNPSIAAPVVTVVNNTACAGGNGQITITSPASGVTYSINGGTTFQASNVFSNLAAGTYSVVTKNIVSGCISSAFSANVLNNAASLPAIAQTTTNATSCTTPNGSIVITAPVGPNIVYSINNGSSFQASGTFSSLSGGTYNILAKDNVTNCVSATVVSTITSPVVPAPVATVVNNGDCSGTSPNGSITFTSPVPLVNYSFSIDNGLGYQAGAIFSSLSAGTYTVLAKENTSGCVSTANSYTITNVPSTPATPVVTIVNSSNCTTPNGSITVTSPSPVSNFTFSKDGGLTFQASNLFSNLNAGSYSIVVKSNATGCTSAAATAIVDAPAPVTPMISVTSVTNCSAQNGTITVSSPAVNSGYSYSIDNGVSFQAGNVFPGLAAGSYQVVVKNISSGCVSSPVSATINTTVPATPTFTVKNPAVCTVPDGIITFVSPLPLSDYNFSIDNGVTFSSSNVFTGLQPGVYQLVVKANVSGCVSAASAATLNPPAVTVPAATGSNLSSCVVNNGSVSFTVASPASISSYRFSIDGGVTFQNSPVFTGLAAGTYNPVSLFISSGCTYSGSAIVLSTPAVSVPSLANTPNTFCEGSPNGSINVLSPIGQNIEYSINGGVSWQTSTLFSNLAATFYTVIVRNTTSGCLSPNNGGVILANNAVFPASPAATSTSSNSCISPNGTITFTSPSPLNNYLFSIDGGANYQATANFGNLQAGTYTTLAKDKITGCTSLAPASVTVLASAVFPAITVNSVAPTSCSTPNGSINFSAPLPFANYQFSIDGGLTFNPNPVFNNLGAGTYNIVVKSLVTGCTGTPLTASIVLNAPPVANPVVTVVNATSCSPVNGQITVSSPSPAANYRFSADGGVTFQDANVFTNLSAGTYNIVAMQRSTGCVSTAVTATITAPAPLSPVLITVNPSSCSLQDGTITVTAPVPLVNYTFSKDNGLTFQPGNIFSGLAAGGYNIVARHTATGCVSPATLGILTCVQPHTLTLNAYKNGGVIPAASAGLNDVLNYVITVQGGVPTSAPTLTDVLSTNQQYITNSATAANWALSGGTAAWFGPSGNGTTTATYAGAIAATTNGSFVPVYGSNSFTALNTVTGSSATSVTFANGGDGFEPIYWKTENCEEKVMIINHVPGTDPPKCWNLTTNSSCNADMSALSGANQNYLSGLFSGFSQKVNNKLYMVNVSNGANGTTPGKAQWDCIDLNPAGNPVYCSGYPKSFPGYLSDFTLSVPEAGSHPMLGYDTLNNRLYFAYDSLLNYVVTYGLDLTTGAVTEAPAFNKLNANPIYSKAVFLTNNRLIIEEGYDDSTPQEGVYCLDISNWPSIKDCNPANTPGVFTRLGNTGVRVSPLLSNTGAVTGFCTGLNSCYNLNGIPVSNPPGYIPSHGVVNEYLVSGTKVITMSGLAAGNISGPVYCYDFATNTSCGIANVQVNVGMYGMDWRVTGKCFLVFGDGGILQQWGIEPAGLVQNSAECLKNSCTEISNTVPDPALRFCGPQVNNIQFKRLRITNMPAVHTGTTVTIRCSGTDVATYNVPANASGFERDISGVVNYATCPSPEISVSFKNTPLGVNQTVRTDVTYDNGGRFPEICYNALVNLCDGNNFTNSATISGGGTATVSGNVSISSNCVPLPVTLTSFIASSRNCEVKLNWQTAEELNFDRFELERSTDGGVTFSSITTVRATGSGSSYAYTDNSAASGKNLYRLRMVDIDGKSKYSNVLLVSLSCDGTQTIILYPNPVNDRTTISGLKKGDRIDLVNSTGQLLVSKLAVNEQEQLDLSRYASGLYIVIVSNEERKLTAIKVVKN